MAGLLSAACDPPPPVKAASGERISGIAYEERFPLSNEAKEVALHGDRLRQAVELMEKQGIIAMSGTYEAPGMLDKSTLILTVTTADKHERTLSMKNCAEPKVCAFFTEAVKAGVAEKLPLVCRGAVACVKR